MKPFAQNPARRSRHPRSADSLVRKCQAIQCDTRTKLSALRCTAASPGFVWAALLFTLLATAPSALPAIPTLEVPVEAWVKRNGVIVTNGGGYDRAAKVVTDAHGDIIVTGSTSGPFNVNASDMLTSKYSGIDGSVLWSRRYNGLAGGHEPTGLALDAGGNVVVTGPFGNGTNIDYYTAKYAAADGALMWEKRFNGPANLDDYAFAVAVDGSGNVVVTGQSDSGEPDFGGHTDYHTAKYASSDGALLWEKRYNGPGNSYDRAQAVAVDASGNIAVTGFSWGTNSNYDCYTAKYAAADGALIWEKRYNGPANSSDFAQAVAIDVSGNVIVTGNSSGTNSFNSDDTDFYTAKYAAADGTLVWERRYSGPANQRDGAASVVLDDSGNVVVTGYSYNGPPNNDYDYYTAKYASVDGALLWEKRGPGAGAAVVVGSGTIVVTGYSSVTNGNYDYYTAKYSAADGALLWEQRYNGPANYWDSAAAVAIDANGNVVVTGSSLSDQWNGWDWYTAKYGSADGSLLWEQRYDGPRYSIVGEHARAVAIDSNGDVVVTGESSDPSYPSSYTGKYAGSNGAVIWEQRTNSYDARAMALDVSGNVVVTGCNSQPFQNEFCRTVKYAARDGSILWEQDGGGSALVVDQSGNVVVTGSRTVKYAAADGAVLWEQEQGGFAIAVDQSGNVVVTAGGFTAKYSAEDGALLWGSHSSVHSETAAVVVDGNGNAVVTGRALQTPLSNWDYYTAKYAAADGALLWEKYYNGPDEPGGLGGWGGAGTALAVDSINNVVVTGYSGLPCRGCFRAEIYTAKYAAADGTLLWEQRYSEDQNKPGGAVVVDGNDNVVLTAFSTSIGCGEPAGCIMWAGGYYTAKYAAANGALLWEQRYNGGDSFSGYLPLDLDKILSSRILALGPDGSVVVTGTSDGDPGPAPGYELTTVKYVMTQVTYPTPVVLSLALSFEGARLRFTGDAGRSYRLQRASDPAGPWSTFATLTAPPDGAVEHLDPPPPASPAFYRVAAP